MYISMDLVTILNHLYILKEVLTVDRYL